jgi:glycosyltransferase involved in cell wall biosynthesis
MGHDVTVLTTKEEPSQPSIEEIHGYTVVRVSPGVTIVGNDIAPAIARYLWGIDSEDFDVIHAHSHLYFSTNLAALKRRLGGLPLAITNHGLYSQSAPEWIFDLYLRTLARWTFNQADVVFCYTENDKQHVQDLGVQSNIKVVPNGIDTKRFTPKGPTSNLVTSNGLVVLFVGRLVEGKRPNVAIEAFAKVLTEYPNSKLYFCGDGPLQKLLKEQVRELEIDESVTFLGHVPYDEMPKVYRNGDVLILPSRTEGVPRTVLEAMNSGVPVVCSQLDQLEEIVEEYGELVNPKTDSSFAQSIMEWFEADTSPKLGDIEYEWAKTVEKTTEELQMIAT